MELLQPCHSESSRLLELSEREDNVLSVKSMDNVLEGTKAIFDTLTETFEDEEEDVIWQDAASDLINTVCNLRGVTRNLIKRVTKLEQRDGELTQTKKELEDLKRKSDRLEKTKQKLIIGQIAFELNEAVLLYVFKGIGDHKKLSIYTIHHLESAIEKEKRFADTFSSDKERKTAEERWDKLKTHIGWQNKHYRDYDFLKGLCLSSAHPHIPDKQLQDAITGFCHDPHLKGVCEEFFEMIKKIRQIC